MDYPVNAGKIPVTALKGSSYFDSADSFAMIRGGHVDVAIMGGLEVDEKGNLANWAVPGSLFWVLVVQWTWLREPKN
jgi:3-oxoacid CoA-transferase